MKIATRGSKLALWQAEHVRAFIEGRFGGTVELVVIKTSGDRIQDRPLAEVGGKGLFVKEIEEALIDGRADLAVHSMKDVPPALAHGLVLGAISAREDPRDALLVRPGLDAATIEALPRGARVGTSSLRRSCQLRALRPDLVIDPLRGNVDTRLRKLQEGQHDAIILAAAGLVRLGLGGHIRAFIPESVSLPAVGQGALGLEHRAGDDAAAAVAAAFADAATSACVRAERAFSGELEGSCRTPIAAHATLLAGVLRLSGLVGSVDGSEVLRVERTGPVADPEPLGVAAAVDLLARGARRLLQSAEQSAEQSAVPSAPGDA